MLTTIVVMTETIEDIKRVITFDSKPLTQKTQGLLLYLRVSPVYGKGSSVSEFLLGPRWDPHRQRFQSHYKGYRVRVYECTW